MDVIVLGAGVAGSAVARHALSAGLRPIVVGRTSDRASDNALCVMRAGWFDKDGVRTAARYGVAYYREIGALFAETALVSRAGKEPKMQGDYYGIHPQRPLVDPDIEAHAVEVGDGWVVLDNGERLEGGAVVACAGVGNVHLGLYEAKELLYGATAVLFPASLAHPIRVHHFGPYNNIMAVDVNGKVRVGSSKAPNPEQAQERLRAMLDKAKDVLLPEYGQASVTVGCRVMPSAEPAAVRRVSERLWTVAGLGRVGYALSPAAGAEVVRQVCASTT